MDALLNSNQPSASQTGASDEADETSLIENSAESQPEIQVSVDIEKISNSQPNAIGLFVGDRDGETHFKAEWWFKIDEKDIEPRCKAEFWDKNPASLKRALDADRSEAEQVQDFVKTYDSIHSKLGVEERKLKLISDNPDADYGGLAPLVKRHCNREHLRFTSQLEQGCREGSYRSISDTGEVAWLLGVGDIVSAAADEIQPHDHLPANDAENTWVQHLIVLDFASRVRSKYGDDLKNIAQESGRRVVDRILAKREKQPKCHIYNYHGWNLWIPDDYPPRESGQPLKYWNPHNGRIEEMESLSEEEEE